MPQLLITLDDIRAGCLERDPTAWRAFVRMYGPLTKQLVSHYFRSEPSDLLDAVFIAARADDGAFFRSFTGKGQKEFLLPWLRHTLRVGRERRGPAKESPLTPQNLPELLKSFPQLQQSILLLILRGYSGDASGVIAKSSPQTAEKVQSEALVKLASLLGEPLKSDFFSRDHSGLFAALEAERGEECLSDHFFVHFEDGGTTTWRDREQGERHMAECLPCLSRFTDYREAHHFFRTLPHLDEKVVGAVTAKLGFPAESSGKKPLWRRVWGR